MRHASLPVDETMLQEVPGRRPSRIAMLSQSSTSTNSSTSSSNKEPKTVIVVSDRISFLCGLLAGIFQAGLFNPVDRALYLSIKNHVPFLTASNFVNPYQGFSQSVVGRALSGGLYYPLEHYFSSLVPPESGPWANFLAGTAAGMTNALILNPITAVKYKTWSRDQPTTMLREALTMWQNGGIRPFSNGLYPTLCRDVVFGGCYTYVRLELQWYGLPPAYQWAGNMFAAALATVLSGPLNLARNVQYATTSRCDAPTIRQVLVQLHTDLTMKQTILDQWHHIQARLRIGWGTARVAVGMAFGQFIYEELMWRMAVVQQIPVDDTRTTDSAAAAAAAAAVLDKRPTLNRNRRPSLVQLRRTRLLEQQEQNLKENMQMEDV